MCLSSLVSVGANTPPCAWGRCRDRVVSREKRASSHSDHASAHSGTCGARDNHVDLSRVLHSGARDELE
jgi:hypothetical protein